jgi:imidazolonepropionase
MTERSRDGGALVAPRVITGGGAPLPRRGDELGRPSVILDGALAWEDGILTYVGPASGLEGRPPMRLLDDVTVVPGFVDAHTHLPFVGWRADEFEARLAGRSYRELHAGGGIPRSAHLLAEASDEQVLAFCLPLVGEMLDAGTTTLELKTGYGLSVDAELRQARLARRLGELAPQTCSVTLLACHAVPDGIDRRRWVRLACEELIPAASAEGLADAVDIYVEDIAFDLADLEAVATAARLAGLPLRVHADQLGPSGAARRAAELGARTADHLNHADPEGVRALGSGSTLGLLLPASTFLMRGRVPPVRELLDAGAPIAIATDFNPGTSPVLSMPEAIAIGCALYGMSPYEALTASTANAAWALGLNDRLGTLEVGKQADFLCLEGDDFRHVPYRPGHDPVLHTFVAGGRVGGR